MTKIDKMKMKEMYEQGYAPSVIAKKFGVSRQYVRQAVVALGCKPACQKTKISTSMIRKEKMRRDFLSKKSIAEIVELYGISENTVRQYLKHCPETAEEYANRKKQQIRKSRVEGIKERNQKICSLRASGESVNSIAEQFNLSVQTIYSICRKGSK